MKNGKERGKREQKGILDRDGNKKKKKIGERKKSYPIQSDRKKPTILPSIYVCIMFLLCMRVDPFIEKQGRI